MKAELEKRVADWEGGLDEMTVTELNSVYGNFFTSRDIGDVVIVGVDNGHFYGISQGATLVDALRMANPPGTDEEWIFGAPDEDEEDESSGEFGLRLSDLAGTHDGMDLDGKCAVLCVADENNNKTGE